MVVIVFAAVMLVAGQLYIESRENKSVRIPTAPAVQIAFIPLWRSCRSSKLDQSSGWRVNNIAVRSSRHQAILHFAARGQLVSQPQSHGQQYNRNCQAGDRCTPVSALFGVGHRPERPELVEVKHPGAAARYYHFSTENDGGDPPPRLFRWLPGAPGCTRSVIARPIVSQQTMK